MILKKVISMILLISLSFTAIPQLSLANEEIIFNEKEAKELLYDIRVCKEETPLLKEKILNLENKNSLQNEQLNNLQLNIDVYKKISEEYKNEFVSVSDKLKEEKSSRPSRLIWFSSGVVATLIAILTIGILTH